MVACSSYIILSICLVAEEVIMSSTTSAVINIIIAFLLFPHTDLFYHLLSITPYVSQIELPLAWFFLSFNQTIIKHNIINIGKTILFLE